MCAQTAPRRTDLPEKASPLVEYLRGRVRTDGAIYIKSRVIAEEIPLSSKEIGSFMKRLEGDRTELSVEAWSYTNGTTWRVSRA
ncbi:DUF7123 family protein [Salinibaculum rarum]|jgi:hypothetical protein|uniref:DUF7123 family protein n=1 Tax=Salinibaculum rarum TaxID=3058903 RepID=UPI00265D8C56|nr:hypothetical protein [Salinibaculum sp. KK48]